MRVEAPGTATGTSVTERAYQALRHDAVVVDRSDRLRMRFSGAKAAESLTGLVTNDVAALSPGSGQYAAALTPKGKVIADVRIFARGDDLLVDVGAAAAPGWVAMIRKFVNPRLAKYEDLGASMGDLGVFGRRAPEMLSRILDNPALSTLADYGHLTVAIEGASLMIARVPDFSVDGFDIIGPRAALDTLRLRLIDDGAVGVAGDALLIARIEAGRPEWGIDMDDSMLAQEVDLDRLQAISYTKGCYTGQETVARVHYRGHVNRQLRGLRFAEPVLPPVGAELVDGENKVVGATRSAAFSPRLGGIALAIVRREIETGTMLRARWADGEEDATVASLPFPA